MKISNDGAAIAIEWDATEATNQPPRGVAAVSLVNIQGITLSSSPRSSGCFSLVVDDGDNPSDLRGVFQCLGRSCIFRDWILALTCGANAFQQRARRSIQPQTRTKSGELSTVDLMWQGARLRIFELAEQVGLELAVDTVTKAISEFLDRRHRRDLAFADRNDAGELLSTSRLFLRLASMS